MPRRAVTAPGCGPDRVSCAHLSAGYRIDFVVADSIIVEVKAVEALTRRHEAQTLTYLRLSGLRIAFLMNFNVVLFKSGLKRFIV